VEEVVLEERVCGADLVQQYLYAGLVDELELAIAPVLLGDGVRLFDRIDPRRLRLELLSTIESPRVTHVRYAVHRR
jgi:dihydrofolate reductase